MKNKELYLCVRRAAVRLANRVDHKEGYSALMDAAAASALFELSDEIKARSTEWREDGDD